MKALQSHFTTVEQSKRLLELGVPADSADCRYENNWHHVELHTPSYTIPVFGHPRKEYNDDIPCWSVGRLIEIFIICTPYVEIRLRTRLVEQLIASYEDVIKHGLMDFSKLEE